MSEKSIYMRGRGPVADAQIRAILAGATQYRVPVPKPPAGFTGPVEQSECRGHWLWSPTKTGDAYRQACPFGGPGTVLAIKEAYRVLWQKKQAWINFRATCSNAQLDEKHYKEWTHSRVCPPQQMPPWAVRIKRRVTQVWVERLRSISRNDAMEEGVTCNPKPLYYITEHGPTLPRVEAFAVLWERIYGAANGPTEWENNPLVFACKWEAV